MKPTWQLKSLFIPNSPSQSIAVVAGINQSKGDCSSALVARGAVDINLPSHLLKGLNIWYSSNWNEPIQRSLWRIFLIASQMHINCCFWYAAYFFVYGCCICLFFSSFSLQTLLFCGLLLICISTAAFEMLPSFSFLFVFFAFVCLLLFSLQTSLFHILRLASLLHFYCSFWKEEVSFLF